MTPGTRALVLGCGNIGAAVAVDLAQDPTWHVTVADAHEAALSRVASHHNVLTVIADLGTPARVTSLAADHDIIVGALPSAIGLQTLAAVVDAGRRYVDISFMDDDALALDEAARARGVTCVVDCGVAPGVSNLMVGWAASQLTRVERVAIYVGGLPVERQWPFDYKAGFAASDVIEEYTRPARFVERGRVVVKPALTDIETLTFESVGALEAFNTDGLRTLLTTIDAPSMIEKTLRYPGHADLMRVFAHLGLFGQSPIAVDRQQVVPRRVLETLLFPQWRFTPGEADIVVMRVEVSGEREGAPARFGWDLVDRYDPATGFRAMSRTTAFPAASMARLVAMGAVARPGVCAPEAVAALPGVFETVVADLGLRGVHITAHA